ncbi:hypothetical protein [Membranihabitans marinus]|uniref:hypothetical protein n=1 Tax=Membranihabitans marinus TaxID=1227546 RepID=UPI001F2C9A30|nr:hypothetical protein [Membranihabitans marinus]
MSITVYGQSPNWDEMIDNASRLVRDTNVDERIKAFEFLNQNLGQYMVDYDEELENIEGLSILNLPEQDIKIISYQLYIDTSTYQYGGWIYAPLLSSPIFLNDQSPSWEMDADLDYLSFTPDQWYGVLYYQALPLTISEDQIVLALFGYDSYKFFTKRKLIETIAISRDKIQFGLPLIQMEKDLPKVYFKSRFILDYAVQAAATMRYDIQHEKIIFDHLMFMKSDIPQQNVMRVPDGTYSGFIVHPDGILEYEDKVFHEVLDEAPGGRTEKGENTKETLFGENLDDKTHTKKRGSKLNK